MTAKNKPAISFFSSLSLRAICLAFIFLSCFYLNASADPSPDWVSIRNKTLVKQGKPFKFIGANAVNLVFYDDWGLDVQKAIRQAKENNLQVLRLYLNWGWGKPEDYDRVIDIASKNGLYLILVLTDCCCSRDYSSDEKYFQVHAPFCNITNAQSKKAFKNFINQTLMRKNSVNHRIYRDEPAILAWEISNELEYWRFSSDEVRGWIEEICAYIKTLDKRHLLTIGISTHDFESLSQDDLFKLFASPLIDFFSYHFYPQFQGENLNKQELQENGKKIESLSAKFLALGKPVILAELGFSNSAAWNEKIKADAKAAGVYALILKEYMDQAFLSGSSAVMFWGWGLPEASLVPMWWSREEHSVVDSKFCELLKDYRIPAVR